MVCHNNFLDYPYQDIVLERIKATLINRQVLYQYRET